jgi:hypothetical protein
VAADDLHSAGAFQRGDSQLREGRIIEFYRGDKDAHPDGFAIEQVWGLKQFDGEGT